MLFTFADDVVSMKNGDLRDENEKKRILRDETRAP